MSQSRMRKTPVGGGNGSRPRASVAKASGDTGPCKTEHKKQNQKTTIKNKIPKNLRYDLENALVSLCDVWFEDIKPHLIRNNIKLHVHSSGAPGVRSSAASGDHERLPPGAPGCFHLDPGAASDRRQRSNVSCAGYYSTQRTASRVQCPRPRVQQHHSPLSLVPPSSLQITHQHPIPSNNSGCNGKTKPRLRRKSQHPQNPPLAQSNWRVPRLCRTYTTLSPMCTPRTQLQRIHTAIQPQTRNDDFFVRSRHRVKMKHKSTQTEWSSRHTRSAAAAHSRTMSPTPFGRCPGTTTIPRRQKAPVRTRSQSRSNSKPLFAKDLINIIAEKHDKKLRLLYKSPQRDDCPSLMNLIQVSEKKSKESTCIGKKKPWR